MLRSGMYGLLKDIAGDHFQARATQTFLVNNFNYITSKFKLLPENVFLQEELSLFEKLEAEAIANFIVSSLEESFTAMAQATSEVQQPN